MLSKSFIATTFLLALTTSVNADSGSGPVIAPALGVPNPGAGDVQHPTSNAPCGNISIPQNIDSSTPIQADTNGEIAPQITSFAAGANGSRFIQTVQVDASGTGNSFSNAEMVTNGEQAPGSAGSQQLAVKLPEGTKCVGGSSKNRCLMKFTTEAGDGNCVVVTQPATTGQNSTSTTSTNGGEPPAGDGTTGNQNTQPGGPNNKRRMSRKRML